MITYHCSVTGPSKTIPLFLKATSGLSAHHSEASPNAALDLSGCACCQSVRMNLSPVLTDVQRKRDGAGKTRFCVSGPHVMRSVWPPNLVWICHQLECQSFGEVDFGSALKGLNGFMGCIVFFLLRRMDFCLSEIQFCLLSFAFGGNYKSTFTSFYSENNMEWWTEQTQIRLWFLPHCFEDHINFPAS